MDQNQPGSIIGNGSVAMIVAIIALLASATSIGITIYYNKKKDTHPAK
jgi:hypothetical protein